MTKAEVLAYLKSEQCERGLACCKKNPKFTGGLKSRGIGPVKLRKDAKLAKQLRESKLHETQVISLLIDDPKTMTVEQAETQVEELQGGHLEHVLCSCDATLTKTSFAGDLLEEWAVSKDKVRVRCGHGLLYEASKSKKKKTAPTETTFLGHTVRIDKTYKKDSDSVLLAMGGALKGVACRTMKLNAAALKVAKKIGPIHFDETSKCDPFDVGKHLIKKRLGI